LVIGVFLKKMKKYFLTLIALTSITACIPNSKYSITDDYATGFRWFERGMQNNDMQSFNHAISYWEPLVTKGDCDAEYRMGLMYFAALGKEQSFDVAYDLWIKAANGNQQRAQWALGDLYFQDENNVYHHCKKTPDCNIKKDIKEALFWYILFEKSAKYTNEKAFVTHILPKVKSQLSQLEIKAVEIKVSNWNPTPKDCGARQMW